MRLVLASASPRRAELLTAAGFDFEVMSADVDERVRPGESPCDYVKRLAVAKASATLARLAASADQLPSRSGRSAEAFAKAEATHDNASSSLVVIGADTVVVVDDEILGKPVDPSDAERMLRLLSGRTHVVLTGVCVRSRQTTADAVDETRVTVNALSKEQIAWYVASGEGLDKAGAYAIQGLASRFISKIDGAYSNVVGLPMATIDRLIGTVQAASGVLAKGRSSELF